jgi:hypothetical protein
MIRRVTLAAALIVGVGISQAQNKADDVRLFQTFFEDAPITTTPYGDAYFRYASFGKKRGDASVIEVAAQSAFPVIEKLQVGGMLAFRSISPDQGSGESGITDLTVSGRYQVLPGATAISVGSSLTLPIGSEDIGESNFDIHFFGSLRHNVPSGLAITGTFGLELDETTVTTVRFNPNTGDFDTSTDSDRQTAVLIAGGVVYPLPSGLSLVGEFNLRTEGDHAMLSGGVDYKLRAGGRLRGVLGLGLDDGDPNIAFQFGYYMGF